MATATNYDPDREPEPYVPPVDWRHVAEYQGQLIDLVLAGEISIDEANAELAALISDDEAEATADMLVGPPVSTPATRAYAPEDE